MIRFSCPYCGKLCRASDRAAGRKCPCPRCRKRLLIPAAAAVAAAQQQRQDTTAPGQQQLQQQFVVGCPGCGREVPLQEHELSWTIECAQCGTRFVPVGPPGGEAAAAPPEDEADLDLSPELYLDPPRRGLRRGVLAVVIGLNLAAAVLVTVVLHAALQADKEKAAPVAEKSRNSSRKGVKQAPAEEQAPPVEQKPARPAGPPTVPCQMLAAGLERYKGKRVVVTGLVAKLTTTGTLEKVLWEVPEDRGAISLKEMLDKDQADVVCVFRGGCPALDFGASTRIEGTLRGVIATSEVPILIDCVMPRPKEFEGD